MKNGPMFVCQRCEQRVASFWPEGYEGPLLLKNHKDRLGVEYCRNSRAEIAEAE